MIGYKKPTYRYPKGSLKKLTQMASGGKVVRFAIQDLSIRNHLITEVGKVMRNELKLFCSNKYDSVVLVETSQAALEFFTWDSMWNEMSKVTPIILSLL